MAAYKSKHYLASFPGEQSGKLFAIEIVDEFPSSSATHIFTTLRNLKENSLGKMRFKNQSTYSNAVTFVQETSQVKKIIGTSELDFFIKYSSSKNIEPHC